MAALSSTMTAGGRPRARVRPAVPRDLPALARLCRAAAGADDYVLSYLDEMVRAGQILVAQVGRRLVSMLGVSTCLDEALWLGQARTHPAFRRRGVFCRAGKGYLAYRWHFLPPSAALLRRMARRGELLADRKAAFILWAGGEPGVTYASVLWGGITALRAARRAAPSDTVAVFLPYDRRLLARAKRAGYRPGSWGRRAVLYERSA